MTMLMVFVFHLILFLWISSLSLVVHSNVINPLHMIPVTTPSINDGIAQVRGKIFTGRGNEGEREGEGVSGF